MINVGTFSLIIRTLCREMDEITSFTKGAICDEQCLGRCLYVHGVPGTGKVNYFCIGCSIRIRCENQLAAQILKLDWYNLPDCRQ